MKKSARLSVVCEAVEQEQTSSDRMNKFLIILAWNLMMQVKPKVGQLMGIYKINFIQSLLH